MKLFGEFLVENNYITADVLVGSLISQVKLTSPVVEITFRKNIFTSDQILSILQLQTLNNMEFITACKELSLWTPEIEAEVAKEASKGRPPIGQILIKEGHLDSKKLIEALDEYMLYRLEQGSQDIKSDTKQPVVKSTDKQLEILAENTEVAKDDSAESFKDGNFDEFLDYFNSGKYIEFETQIFSLEPERKDFVDSAQDVLAAFMTLRGYYDMLSMNQSKVLSEMITSGLNSIIIHASSGDLQQEVIWEYKATAKSALDLLWRVREQINSGQSEQQAFSEEGNANTLASITKDWDEFSSKLN